MELLNPALWKQQWEAFVSAPYIIASFMAVAGLTGWWLRGIKSERKIDGLEGRVIVFEDRLKFADERAARANEVRDDVIGQFQTYKAEVTAANAGNGALAATAARLEAALDKLVAITNETRSAIGISVGTSSVPSSVTNTISDLYSNTPLALRAGAEADKNRLK
jgi:hypothetical protein